jgi:hypothetical protein
MAWSTDVHTKGRIIHPWAPFLAVSCYWRIGTFRHLQRLQMEVLEGWPMAQHLSRARLTRCVAGATFTMIAFTAALFTAAHHFAG